MKLGILPSILLLCLVAFGNLSAQTHPRLFFDAADVPDLRAKATQQPWADMLATAELASTVQDGSYAWFPRPHYFATLYLFTGNTSYADKARDHVLQLISASWWASSSGNALDQGTAGGQVAVAYDLCFPAWVGQTVPDTVTNPVTGATVNVASKWVGMSLNAAVSQALRENGDRLIASGGSGWPGDLKPGNNWWGVRYGGAGLCYLASDDTINPSNFNSAVTRLIQYFRANLGSGADSRGWNVEGLGYLGFPGQTSMPFVLALRRNTNAALGSAHLNRNLVNDIPGLRHTLLTTFPGAIAQTKRHNYYNDTNRPGQNLTFSGIGLRPEFNDDHPNLQPEGTAAMAFALVPSEYHAGMKWMFRRFWGDLGDRTWDSTSGQSLWALLYYPDSLPEQNPADAWGLVWKDPSMGMFVLRNRYQDANDTVFQATANLRPTNGGHGGPDDLSFRLWSLGVPWVVGAGRNYSNPIAGQTTLSPDDPSTLTGLVPAINNTVVDSLLRAAGDGYLVFRSDQIQTGVEDLTRRYAVDYNSAQTGAAATVIISDSSANAAFWRMNTPSFNTITTDNATRTFTFTSPDGKTMRGRVVWPETVSFRTNTSVFDRTHVRFPYKNINYTGPVTGWDTSVPNNSTGNNWVDFQTPDGRAVVVLTVVDNGQSQPAIVSSGTGNNQTITVGSRTFTLAGDSIQASGWERPDVAITSPSANQNFNAGATNVSVTGTAAVPTGSANTLDRVEIYLDDVFQGNAALSGSSWSYTLTAVPVGAHTVTARAIDSAANEREVKTTFRVNNSIPPAVALTWPGPTQQLYDQQTVTLRGTVSDPDGTIVRVEIWWEGAKLGDATLGTGAAVGTWSYAVPRQNTGTDTVYALAIDNSGDSTATDTRTLVFSRFFSDVPIYGDAGRYTGGSVTDTNRWRTVDEGNSLGSANPCLKTLQLSNYWLTDQTLFLPDSATKNWHLRYKAKADQTNDTYAVHLATQVALRLSRWASVRNWSWFNFLGGDLDGPTTKVWENKNAGAGILPTLKWHPTELDGTAYVTNKLGSLVANDPAFFDLTRQFSGIPVDSSNNTLNTWHDVEIKKVGKSIQVWINGLKIMDGTDARINLAGPVGLINTGGTADFSFDDIEFTKLDASGNPIPNAPGTIAVTGPVADTLLTASSTQIISGTVADADGIASVEVFSGFTRLGTATVSSGTWSYSWTVPAGATAHALWARVTDALGHRTDSAPVTVHVGSAPSGTNALTLEQDTSVSGRFGLRGTVSAVGSASLVQIYRNGVLAGTATVSGGNWSWSVTGLNDGSFTYTARLFDSFGREVTAPQSVTITATAPTASITAPAADSELVVGLPVTIRTTLVAASTGAGTIAKADFYDGGRWIGTGTNSGGNTWDFVWTPQFYGTRTLTVMATDNWGTTTTSAPVSVRVVPDAGPKGSILAYLGGTGQQELFDVMELSDGTLLLAGTANNLSWSAAPQTALNAGTLPNGSTGKTAFLMRVASDLQSVLGLWHLPAGQVENIRWIKTTSKPGAPTGDLYISGALNTTGGYFIGRLNGNFVDSIPTGFVWTRTATQSATYGDNTNPNDSRFLQTWDVGGDGRVIFVDQTGTSGTNGAIRIFFASGADGSLLKLNDLRASHWPTGVSLNDDTRTQAIGSTLPSAAVSAVSIPSDVRSWTEEDRLTILPDGNGQIKRGRWPYDLFFPVQDKDGNLTADGPYGYTGYRSMGKFRVGGITIDRDTGDFFIGYNVQSAFWDHANKIQQPDFEPAVIAYSSSGALKWWSRLYSEVIDANANNQIDAGETRISLPDQYVDGLTMDYSVPAMPQVVVSARCHGNDASNFWSGNAIAANPSAKGFQNRFTGTEGDIHISWIGKLSAATGDLQRATWLAGYFRRDVTLNQGNYPEPIHDGWPNHNLGWPNLTTTRVDSGSIRVDASGRVYVVGVGPRLVTTFNAHQKLPKKTSTTWDEGNSPWAAFVRVFEPNLETLAYCSAVTGVWTYPTPTSDPVGADNTQLRGIFPTTNGALIVGCHLATAGTANGNAIPVNKVPSWATATPTDQTAIFGKMSFLTSANVAPSISDIPNQTCFRDSWLDPIGFTISDLETEADALVVTVASSNTALIDGTGLVLGGSGTDRTLSITPKAGQTGTATITVSVSDGAKTTSDTFTLTVSVNTNIAPTCTLTTPAANSAWAPGAGVTITADATDSDGTIARVEFFVNGTKVGQDTTAPYSYTWTATTEGIHTIYARAVDNTPGATNSSSVSIYVGTQSAAPVITSGPTAGANPVTTASTLLSVTATDSDTPAGDLIYTWSLTSAPTGAIASFSPNATNAARNTTFTFDKPGTYTVSVSVRDTTLATATQTLNITVQQTPTSISISPANAQVMRNSSLTFTATARDQFSQTISPAPTFTWNITGGGTVNASGQFSAGNTAGGPHTLTATASGATGTTQVTVVETITGLIFQDAFDGASSANINTYNSNYAVTWPGTPTQIAALASTGLKVGSYARSGRALRLQLFSTNSGAKDIIATNNSDLVTVSGTANSIFYASAVFRADDLGDDNGNQIWAGVTVTRSGATRLLRFGLRRDAGIIKAFVSNNGAIAYLPDTITAGQTVCLVMKHTAGSGAWGTSSPTLNLALNPPSSTEPVWPVAQTGGGNTDSPNWTLTGVQVGASLAAHSGGTNTATVDGRVDEVRVGMSYASVVPVLPAFALWQDTYWPDSTNLATISPTADPDGDGIANLLEYALGGDPSAGGDTTILPTVATATSGSSRYLTLTFTPQRSDVTYSVEANSDLGATWTPLAMPTLTVGQSVTVTDTTALDATNPRRFLRLKVSQP